MVRPRPSQFYLGLVLASLASFGAFAYAAVSPFGSLVQGLIALLGVFWALCVVELFVVRRRRSASAGPLGLTISPGLRAPRHYEWDLVESVRVQDSPGAAGGRLIVTTKDGRANLSMEGYSRDSMDQLIAEIGRHTRVERKAALGERRLRGYSE